MSSISRKRSGSDNLDAPPAKKLTIKLSFTRMSLKDAHDIAAQYNKVLFARHTVSESWKARMVILSVFSAKYKKLDDIIKAQDLAIDRSRAVIAALDRLIQNFETIPQGAVQHLPGRAIEMLADILRTFNGVNQRESSAQSNIAANAEKTRVVANAAKMVLADFERNRLLPFFVTPIASRGCGVELGGYTGLAATQRTTRTWAAKFALEQMVTSGAIHKWYDVDTADVAEVLALDLGSIFGN